MEIGAALAADFDLLTDALNDPDVDIVGVLRLLARDARDVVDAFAGLSLSLVSGGELMTFTALEDGYARRDAVSSMLLPLMLFRPGHDDAGVSLVLYGARAGAFVDLAAELAWLTGQSLASFSVDRDLDVPDAVDSLSALRDASTINQAVGVLIGRGYVPSDAEHELDERALAAATTRLVIADLILTFPPEDTPDPAGDPW